MKSIVVAATALAAAGVLVATTVGLGGGASAGPNTPALPAHAGKGAKMTPEQFERVYASLSRRAVASQRAIAADVSRAATAKRLTTCYKVRSRYLKYPRTATCGRGERKLTINNARQVRVSRQTYFVISDQLTIPAGDFNSASVPCSRGGVPLAGAFYSTGIWTFLNSSMPNEDASGWDFWATNASDSEADAVFLVTCAL